MIHYTDNTTTLIQQVFLYQMYHTTYVGRRMPFGVEGFPVQTCTPWPLLFLSHNHHKKNKHWFGILFIELRYMYNNKAYDRRIWNKSYKTDYGNEIECELNFCNCVRSLKKFKASIEPVTSRYRCDVLTNWGMKPLMLGAGQLCVHMFP